jgi:hypothetical protein
MTPYAAIVWAMTQTMKLQLTGWRHRTGMAALGAAVAMAAILGPQTLATRTGASDVVGHSTVSAADTITSTAILAEVAAAGRRGGSKLL